ncbi:hypothetical protein [Flavobacterium sp.]|uniref:hypothetical protein n=1 Tax=Flavobacterium sp. TaxID=239 RepID=UPI0037BE7763
MKYIKKIIFLFLIMIFISCDPPHNIVFINNGQSEAKIKIHIDTIVENNEFMNFDELQKDTIVYKIKPSDTCTIFFGIGTWSDSEVKNISKSIKKIEIGNEEFQTIYKTKNKIEKLLIENRDDKIGWETEIIFDIR